MKPALLILDPQNDFFQDENPYLAEFQRVVSRVNAAITLFREHSWLVVFIQHTSATKLPGSYEWAIYRQFDCRPEDIRLTKTYKDAFCATHLDLMLSSHDVDFLVVSGFLAEHCVLATYRGALECGYRAALLTAGIAGFDSQAVEAIERSCAQISLEELRLREEHYEYGNYYVG